MSQLRRPRLARILMIAAALNVLPGIADVASVAQAANHGEASTPKPEKLRAEVAKVLLAAEEMLNKQQYKEALAKLGETDAIADKTAFEIFIIERFRAVTASAAGDKTLAARSFESILASGRLQPADQLKNIQALAGLYFEMQDYQKAIDWLLRYRKEGGNNPNMQVLLGQSYYFSNDVQRAAVELQAALEADRKAGRAPTEDQLLLAAHCAVKLKDQAGHFAALELLTTHYPKKEYWEDTLNLVQGKPGFAERLVLDVYRLKQAVGYLYSTEDIADMAYLATRAGFPAEARKVLDFGFQSGALAGGPDAAKHKRAREQAAKAAADDMRTMAQSEAALSKAKEGTGLVNLGFAYVGLGQLDKGIALMEQGMQKGGFKYVQDARLHLAIAYLLAGRKADAVNTFKTVQGTDGAADIARLWMIHLNRQGS